MTALRAVAAVLAAWALGAAFLPLGGIVHVLLIVALVLLLVDRLGRA